MYQRHDSGFKDTFTTGVRKIGRVPVGAATGIVIVIAVVITVVVVDDVVSRPDLALRADEAALRELMLPRDYRKNNYATSR